MIDKVVHIGPALNVQGGISSVLVSYKKLFNLSDECFLASYNGSFVKSLPRLLFICLKLLFGSHKRFDFYQIHTSSYGSFFRKYLISLCLRCRRQKYTAHVHGSQFKRFCNQSPKLIRCLIRNYFNSASAIICITPDMEEFLCLFLKTDKQRFFIVPNPCETISSMPADLENHELPVKIVFSGRYGKRKGVYDLIKAFDQAHFNVPIELYLYGDGEVEKVKEMVAESHKAQHIHVSNWLPHEQYLEKLATFDFLVLPSYAETFGMSLVEAMGYGLPVISTFADGIPFVVENKKNGFLNKPGDIDALIRTIEILAHDKSLRVQMGKNAWEDSLNKFKGSIILSLLNDIYTEPLLAMKKC